MPPHRDEVDPIGRLSIDPDEFLAPGLLLEKLVRVDRQASDRVDFVAVGWHMSRFRARAP